MEEILILLIEDDIKMTNLVHSLRKLNIDATSYLPNKSCIVFKLLKLDYEKYSDEYFTKIESGNVNSATEICVWLLGLERGC